MPLRDVPYRTVRWGRDLQVWLLEGREYCDANDAPDGEGKSILGQRQRAWLAETLGGSNATFKIVISATPVVGPDREQKTDNHANAAFATEGRWLRDLLARHGAYVVNGDRHWQYVSRDDATGLVEFGCGPVSDAHVQGWDEGERPEHRYLNLVGGFLSVDVERVDGTPAVTFTHHDVAGVPLHTERFFAE